MARRNKDIAAGKNLTGLEAYNFFMSLIVPECELKILEFNRLVKSLNGLSSFEAEKPGVYLGQCAEYCGNQHANMLLRVEARETDGPLGFDAWVANQQQPPVDDESTRRGKEVFLAFACQSCHLFLRFAP